MAHPRRVDRETLPLEDHAQIGRLLHLDQEHALADRVRRPRRDVEGVACRHSHPVERREQLGRALPVDPRRERVRVHRLLEAHVHGRLGRVGSEDDPAFGLAEARAQVLARERARRVRMHHQPLAGVEQLHEEPGLRAERRDVGSAEVQLRLRIDRVTQEPAVRKSAEADLRLSSGGGHRADPVLAHVVSDVADATKGCDRGTAENGPWNDVRREALRVRGSHRMLLPSDHS